MTIDLTRNFGKIAAADLAGMAGSAVASGARAVEGLPGVYPASVKASEGAWFFLARTLEGKRLVVAGTGKAAGRFEGNRVGEVKFCPLSTDNAQALRETFPWTAPVPIGRRASFGTGDRLGVAAPGHPRGFSRS